MVWDVHNQVVHVDESAGVHSSIPLLRRCGYGLVMLDDDRQVKGAFSSSLAGEQQTHVVACLEAILTLLRRSQGDVEIRPDCNAAIDGLRAAIRDETQQFC